MSNPLVEVLAELEAPKSELEHWLFVNDFDFWIELGVMTGPVVA